MMRIRRGWSGLEFEALQRTELLGIGVAIFAGSQIWAFGTWEER